MCWLSLTGVVQELVDCLATDEISPSNYGVRYRHCFSQNLQNYKNKCSNEYRRKYLVVSCSMWETVGNPVLDLRMIFIGP